MALAGSISAIIGAKRLGSAQLLEPTSIDLTLIHDAQLTENGWCWREICPGRTGFEAALTKLTEQGYVVQGNTEWGRFDSSYVINDKITGTVETIVINTAYTYIPHCIYAASVLNRFGNPIGIAGQWDKPTANWIIWLYFEHDLEVVLRNQLPELTMRSCVQLVNYNEPNYFMSVTQSRRDVIKWQGFTVHYSFFG